MTEEPGVDLAIEVKDDLKEDPTPTEAKDDPARATDDPLALDNLDAGEAVAAEEATFTEDAVCEDDCGAENTRDDSTGARDENSWLTTEDGADEAGAEVAGKMIDDFCDAIDEADADGEPMTGERIDSVDEGEAETE